MVQASRREVSRFEGDAVRVDGPVDDLLERPNVRAEREAAEALEGVPLGLRFGVRAVRRLRS
jgi:hypothetical protein